MFSRSTMGTREMEILIAITLILVSGSSVSGHHSSPQLTTIYPINFTELTSQAYVYTNIVMQTYMEPFILTEKHIRELIDEAFNSPVRCNVTADENCKYINETIIVFRNNVKNLAYTELSSVLFEMRHNIDGFTRHKRAGILGRWVGTLLRDWCDVALQDDITALVKSDQNRRTQIAGLLHTIKFEEGVMKNHSLNLDAKIEDIKKKLADFADETAIKSLIQNEITQLIFHYDKIHDSCNRRVIPSNAIDVQTLSKDLREIESMLHQHDLTLAIPLESVHDYYKLRICSCKILDDGINMTVHIPLKPRNATYQLFSPIYLPFKFGKQICSIQAQDAILINDTQSGRMQVSSAQYLKHCDLGTHLCKLHSIYNPNINSMCLQETFLGKNVTELRDLCPFVCTPIPAKPMINHLKDDEYVITNLLDNTFIEYKDGIRYRLPNTSQDGAWRLKLPCSSRLIRALDPTSGPQDIYIDYVSPCGVDLSRKRHTLQQVIPLQWLQNATRLTTALNREWKQFTPMYSIMPQSEIDAHLAEIAKLNTPPEFAPRHTGILGFFLSFLPVELTDNIYLLSTYICNFIVASLLYYRIRSMRRRLRRVETGLISRAGGGGVAVLSPQLPQYGTTLPPPPPQYETNLPPHHQQYGTTLLPHHQQYGTTLPPHHQKY